MRAPKSGASAGSVTGAAPAVGDVCAGAARVPPSRTPATTSARNFTVGGMPALTSQLDDQFDSDARSRAAASLFGARFRHAASSAMATARFGALRNKMFVLPAAPQATVDGVKAFGWLRIIRS